MNNKSVKKGNQNRINTPRWFYLILVLIPIFFFIILEISLRLFNYGNDYTLFKPLSKSYPNKLFINPDITRKYFSNLHNIPRPVDDAFDKNKQHNSLRIFVLGGSSAEGFPYVANASFPRDLKRRLELLYPDKTIEVINCGISAINSYTVRDFVPSVIEKKPDLVLIYMGHNEYYGALGVASSVSEGKSPWIINTYIKLQNFKTFQLLINAINWGKSLFSKGKVESGTLMARMVGSSLVPLNSEDYKLGINQFETNLTSILRQLKDAKVPVILGSLTCNLKDLKPFVSRKENGLPSADEMFNEAKIKMKERNFSKAKHLFIRAKELDELRFRAPEIFNTIIKNLSNKFSDTFVNVDSIFQSNCENDIVGNELIVDHLHPNVHGYKLLAKSFYDAMKASNNLPKWESANLTESEQDSILNKNFPFTKLDSTIGILTIKVITGAFPFVPRGTPNYSIENYKKRNFIDSLAYQFISRKITLGEAHAKAAEKYFKIKDISNFCSEMDAIISDKPYAAPAYEYTAKKLINSGNFEKSLPYLKKLNTLQPSAFSSKWIGQILVANKEYSKALKYLSQSLSFSQNDPQVWYNIAGVYYFSNKIDLAINAIKESLKLNPKNQLAIGLYQQLKAVKNSGN